jgi:hypothetical protein
MKPLSPEEDTPEISRKWRKYYVGLIIWLGILIVLLFGFSRLFL